MSRALLVTGGTGKQGRAVIDALLETPSAASFTIYALTRDATSHSATALAALSPSIKLIQGNLNDCSAIFASLPPKAKIWGLFSVQAAIGNGATPKLEEVQGKALVDAALANGVSHFVYTSVDRHGSSDDPTYIPHFVSKHNIEKHLEKQTANGRKMSYSILRPVTFMDNFTAEFIGKVGFAMVGTLPRDRKMQLVATSDIGWFAAQAFIHSTEPEYKNVAISLAGDDLTYDEMAAQFQETMGYAIPEGFGFMARGVMWMITELGIMYKWLGDVGYAADIKALRKQHPGLLSWREWLVKESQYEKKK